MKLKKYTLLLSCSAVLLVTLPAPAHALFGIGGAQEITQQKVLEGVRQTRDGVRETRNAVNDVRREVRESADRIIAALRQHSGEQSSYQDKQIEASRRMRDAEQQNAAQRMREEFRARAESGDFDPSPDICLLAGLFQGGGSSGGPGIGTNMVEEAFTQGSGVDPKVRQGGTAVSRGIVDDQLANQGVLGVADPTTNASVILRNPTLDLQDGKSQAAVTRLLRNMTDPFPPQPVTDAELSTPEGVARAAIRAVQQTRASAAGETLAMVMNMRDKVQPVTADGLQSYHDDIAGYNRPWPGVGGQISELQALDIRTLRYYAPSQARVSERATLNEKQLLQQILDLMSVQSRIAYLQLELDTRRAVTETQILSALNN